MDIYQHYRKYGYCIIKNVVPRSEIDAALSEANRLHTIGCKHVRAGKVGRIEDGPVNWLIVQRFSANPVLRGLQFCYRISPVFDALRVATTFYALLQSLLGENIDSVVNTLSWKPPGETDTGFAYHQDCVFRKPRERFRNLSDSFVQSGLALDTHGPFNGGIKFAIGSHLLGDLNIERKTSVMLGSPLSADLEKYGIRELDERDIWLDPGDVALWHPYVFHGSSANSSGSRNRRFIVSGYMRSRDCDGFDAAFREGQPCSLG